MKIVIGFTASKKESCYFEKVVKLVDALDIKTTLLKRNRDER